MNRREAAFAQLSREVTAASRDPLVRKAQKLKGRLFRQQRDFVEDPAKRKAVLCGRGAGKSYALAVFLCFVCLTTAKANCLFVAITHEKAKDILWRLLKELDEAFELGIEFNESALTATFTNAARIQLAGCKTRADIGAFRGEPYHAVVLDESATWHIALLEELMTEAIEPRLRDYDGTLVMAGTPGGILAGPFYAATGEGATTIEPDDQGELRARSRPFGEADLPLWQDVTFEWSLHAWLGSDNTAVPHPKACTCVDRSIPHMWGAALELKRKKGWSDQNPIWRREYLGLWMADDTQLVWRYLPERDDWEPGPRTQANPFGLPAGHSWRYVIGSDLGFSDPFAIQVGAYSDTHPDLHHCYEFEKVGLHIGAIAAAYQKVIDLVGEEAIDVIVGDMDGRGGTVITTLATEYGIIVEPAEKKDKRDNIEVGNGDFIDGRAKILKGSHLSEEMLYLAWDDTGLKERSNQKNNNSDAWLYLARRARHRDAVEPPKAPGLGTPEHFAELQVAEEEEAVEQVQREREEFGMSDWGESTRDTDWFNES